MNQPVRVLNLFTVMNRGGAETMVMNYYRKIDRTKVQFDFMVHRQERGAYDDEIETLGGRIYRMCPIYPQNILKYKRMLNAFFNEHKEYKIIHSHMSELGYFVFRVARQAGIPVRICHAHNTPVFFSETFLEKIKRIPREILARKIRRITTDFFACSLNSGYWLFGKDKHIILMKNALDISRFVYKKDVATIIKKKYHWENKFIVGHVGRFCPQKNHQFLIDIFYEIQKYRSESILILFGDGDLKENIQNKVKNLALEDKVFFMGNRNDVYAFYQIFDVFLFPSLYEGFGNVLLEAQAAGVISYTSKDVVPKTVCVTPLLKYISLTCSSREWKRIILSQGEYEKKDMSDLIRKSGFDVTENASWLCDFYLKKYHQYE